MAFLRAGSLWLLQLLLWCLQQPFINTTVPLCTAPTCTGTLKGNWEAFWAAVGRDHAHAALIWNEGTRAELREALQVGSDAYSPVCKKCY